MTAISASASADVLLAPAQPTRSPRTSIILAELARQHRWERLQRRKARARRARWLALFNRKPFDLIRVQCPLHVTFSGPMPMVYALPQQW
ncbi:MAG: hypothetical protein JO015_00980 [Verrucomicrobia bacterium]|nr:hypothetical protein [Verrucomicrobiota bacterium]